MWKFKSCPRCGGDFFIDKDIDGWYAQCLQCAYRQELKQIAEPKRPISEEELAITGTARPRKQGISRVSKEGKASEIEKN
jgi:ribosomal protein S27AE